MSVPAYRIVDRRRMFGGDDRLFEGTRLNRRDRPDPPWVDGDMSANLSSFGLELLRMASRTLYARVPALQSAIDSIARLSVGNGFIPQFYGKDKAWGEKAEDLLFQWHKICDVRGDPFDWNTNLELWITHMIRDGDVGILLTESDNGYPLVQTIPAHRIAGDKILGERVVGGQFDGARITCGMIFNDYGRAIGVRLVGGSNDEPFTDYSASDLKVWYSPKWSDQCRGIPIVASAISDWGDVKQIRDFFKMAVKAEASTAVVEYNESGTVNLTAPEIIPSGDTAAAALYYERTEGGLARVYKAGSGCKVEFPDSNRPSQNSQEFIFNTMRSAFLALGWPIELAYDMHGIGGAPLRALMEVAKPTIEHYQSLAQRMATNIDAWRIAKAIKNGELPASDEWWMIGHQTPEEITADKGYSAKIDQDDFKLGFTSLKRIAARRGDWWEDLREEQESEVGDLAVRAKRLSDANPPLTFDMALTLLQQRAPAIMPTAEAPPSNNTNVP